MGENTLVLECGHCQGSGKCNCKKCQDDAFGSSQNNFDYVAPCSVCGGVGKIVK